MKKIEAVVHHHKLEDIKSTLVEQGFHGMTVTEVRGFGRQRGHSETYRGAEYSVDFVPKMKIELVVDDQAYPRALGLILSSARTGKIGDGKVFVSELQDAIRVRTGETGSAAI